MRGIARILMIAVLVSFVAGCVGDVEDVIDHVVDEADDFVFDRTFENCETAALTGDENLEDRGAIDHPPGFITERNRYWDCKDARTEETETKDRYRTDGTFTGTFTKDAQLYNLLEILWNRCGRVGSRPPGNNRDWNIEGEWGVVTEEGDRKICTKIENAPGVVTCSKIGSEPDEDEESFSIENQESIYDDRVRERDITCSLTEP